jgi:Flp pilus assembly protein TadG
MVDVRRIAVRQDTRRGRAALLRDCDGAIAVVTALALPAIIGLAALGSEVGTWYVARRTMQGAADSAAFSAATDVMMGDTSGYAAAAKSVTASYHFTDGSNNTVVTVNKPPASGPYSANSSAVEVIITQTRASLLARSILPSLTLTARAVAIAGNAAGSCVLALDPTASGAITANGNPTVDLNCGIATNSSSSSALLLNGNATINATSASIVGNYLINGPSRLNTPDTKIGAPPTADPYESLQVPPYGGCDHTNFTINGLGTYHIQPGVYCGGITINGSPTVIFDAGATPEASIYTIDGGSFTVNGSPNVSGSGVSVVLTSSTHSSYGNMAINGTPTLDLTAPSSGPMAGMVFFQDRNAPSGGSNVFNGTSDSVIGGVLYFPQQQVTLNGNPTAGDACMQLVARTVTFNGHPSLDDSGCSALGAKSIGGSPVVLVE